MAWGASAAVIAMPCSQVESECPNWIRQQTRAASPVSSINKWLENDRSFMARPHGMPLQWSMFVFQFGGSRSSAIGLVLQGRCVRGFG
jgi:hypothetical protein